MAVAGLIVASILYAFDPASHGFYPRCWLYATTGWQCPGCGGLRATHSLLHGQLGDAFRFNPLLVILLPIAASVILIRLILPDRSFNPLSRFGSSIWLWLLGGVAVVFGIARNLR